MDSFFTLMILEISIQTLRVFADRKTLDMSDDPSLALIAFGAITGTIPSKYSVFVTNRKIRFGSDQEMDIT
jgi:hypothetical protein